MQRIRLFTILLSLVLTAFLAIPANAQSSDGQPPVGTVICKTRACQATEGNVLETDIGWMVTTYEGRTPEGMHRYQVAFANRPNVPTYWVLLDQPLEALAPAKPVVKDQDVKTPSDPNSGQPWLGYVLMVVVAGVCVTGWFFTNGYTLEKQLEVSVERMQTADNFELPSANYQLTVVPTLESLEGFLRYTSGQSLKLIKGYVRTWSLGEFAKVNSKEVVQRIGSACSTASPASMQWQTEESGLGISFVSLKLLTFDKDEQTERAGQAAANGESIGQEVAAAMRTGGFSSPSEAADAVARVQTARGFSGLGNGLKIRMITGDKDENA